MGVEPTDAGSAPPPTNFEDWGSHRATSPPIYYCTGFRADRQDMRVGNADRAALREWQGDVNNRAYANRAFYL